MLCYNYLELTRLIEFSITELEEIKTNTGGGVIRISAFLVHVYRGCASATQLFTPMGLRVGLYKISVAATSGDSRCDTA